MKVRRIAVGYLSGQQSSAEFCRKNRYLIGLANLLVLVSNSKIFPNFKEEINV